MDKEYGKVLITRSTWDNGKRTKETAMGYILTKKANSTIKVDGNKIRNQVKANRCIVMVSFTRASSKTTLSTVKETTSIPISFNIEGYSNKIPSLEKDFSKIRMVTNILEILLMASMKAEENTRIKIRPILMKENGITASGMARENNKQKMLSILGDS